MIMQSADRCVGWRELNSRRQACYWCHRGRDYQRQIAGIRSQFRYACVMKLGFDESQSSYSSGSQKARAWSSRFARPLAGFAGCRRQPRPASGARRLCAQVPSNLNDTLSLAR